MATYAGQGASGLLVNRSKTSLAVHRGCGGSWCRQQCAPARDASIRCSGAGMLSGTCHITVFPRTQPFRSRRPKSWPASSFHQARFSQDNRDPLHSRPRDAMTGLHGRDTMQMARHDDWRVAGCWGESAAASAGGGPSLDMQESRAPRRSSWPGPLAATGPHPAVDNYGHDKKTNNTSHFPSPCYCQP